MKEMKEIGVKDINVTSRMLSSEYRKMMIVANDHFSAFSASCRK